MGDLNEIHRTLGQIEGTQVILLKTLEEMKAYQREMNGKAADALNRVGTVENKVDDLEKTKKIAVAGLLGLGSLSGIVGGKLSQIMAQILGGS